MWPCRRDLLCHSCGSPCRYQIGTLDVEGLARSPSHAVKFGKSFDRATGEEGPAVRTRVFETSITTPARPAHVSASCRTVRAAVAEQGSDGRRRRGASQ